MPTSVIDICNLALLRLGHDEITSLNEKSKEARYCSRFFDRTRRATLRSHPWNWAERFATLSLLNLTVTDYDYVYALPTDCLRVIQVVNPVMAIRASSPSLRVDPGAQIGYEIRSIEGAGKVLVTSQADAEIRYVADITDPNAFDEQFIDALAHRLASEMAVPLAGKPSLQKSELQLFILTLNEGKTIDASESRTRVTPGEDLVSARR